MGLEIIQTPNDPVSLNVFKSVQEDVAGGFLLSKDEFKADSKFAPKGTPVAYNLATRKATIVKTLKVFENAAAPTEIKVFKNHEAKVGNIFGKTIGGKAYAITEIDTSNADYDVITIGTAIEDVVAGDVLIEGTAEGADTCDEKNVCNGLLLSSVNIEGENNACSVAIRATVIEAEMPYSLHAKNKESLTSRFAFV